MEIIAEAGLTKDDFLNLLTSKFGNLELVENAR